MAGLIRSRLGAAAGAALQRIQRGPATGAAAPKAPQRPMVIEAVKVSDPVDAIDKEVVARMNPEQKRRYEKSRGLTVLGEGKDARPAIDGCTGCYTLKLELDEQVKRQRIHMGHQARCPRCGAGWQIGTLRR